jgi:hypothetical protein
LAEAVDFGEQVLAGRIGGEDSFEDHPGLVGIALFQEQARQGFGGDRAAPLFFFQIGKDFRGRADLVIQAGGWRSRVRNIHALEEEVHFFRLAQGRGRRLRR